MDCLDEFTKEELIAWIRQNYFFRVDKPIKRDLLFIRWQEMTRKLAIKRDESIEMLRSMDGEKQDELAKQFNAETDNGKRLAILKQMRPYYEQFEKWKAFEDEISKKEAAADRLYKSMADA